MTKLQFVWVLNLTGWEGAIFVDQSQWHGEVKQHRKNTLITFDPQMKISSINISLETIWKGSETSKIRFFSFHSSDLSYLLFLVTKSFGETYRCHVVHVRGSHHGGAHVDSLFRQYCIQWLLFSTTLHRLLDVLPLSQFNHVRCLHASWYGGQTARCDQTTARETRKTVRAA